MAKRECGHGRGCTVCDLEDIPEPTPDPDEGKRKLYIASGLANGEQARRLMEIARGAGWAISYDWTTHGAVYEEGQKLDDLLQEKFRATANKELAGVVNADLVVILLPGGRGTHVELGAALATEKPIFIGPRSCLYDAQATGRYCVFHFGDGVRTFESFEEVAGVLKGALIEL